MATGEGYTLAEAIAERDRLLALGLNPLGAPGDGYVIDGHDMVIKAAATPAHPDTYHLSNSASVAAPVDVLLLQMFSHSIATTTSGLAAQVGETATVR